MADRNAELIAATKDGDLSRVTQAVAKGASVHHEDDYALHWAAGTGKTAIVKFLVENGANVNARQGMPLRWAAGSGFLEIVKYLAAHGADIHAEKNHALKWASENGHLNVVKFLLEKGVDIHAGEDNALRLAAEEGHADVVAYLLEKGANVHAWQDDALCEAAEHGQDDVIRVLLNHGADIHANNDSALRRAIPGMYVAYRANMSTVRLLVENGADINASGALSSAAINGWVDVVGYLIGQGADVRRKDDEAIRYSIDECHTEISALLVAAAGPDADGHYEVQRDWFLQQVGEIVEQKPSCRAAIMFKEKNTPTLMLRVITAAGLLPELFAPSAWQGTEAQAYAMQLHTRLREALPEYRSRIDAVDLTAFQPEPLPTFAGRISTQPKSDLAAGRR